MKGSEASIPKGLDANEMLQAPKLKLGKGGEPHLLWNQLLAYLLLLLTFFPWEFKFIYFFLSFLNCNLKTFLVVLFYVLPAVSS